jgi:hypothetical protein
LVCRRFHVAFAFSLLFALTLVPLVAPPGIASDRFLPVDEGHTVLLPLTYRHYPWRSPFGVEVNSSMEGILLERAEDLGISWVRLHRVSWRAIQPQEGGPYDWSVLSSFESELRSLRRAGLTPIVIVHHSPRWATLNEPQATDCGAIRADKFDDFAAFMHALVARYSQAEFNVHYWELGNEPDVDPTLVERDSVFGCWGDIRDPYYGGRHYGEMLKVVTPRIRAADPQARVLIGGLLLNTPHTVNPALGKPELFLEGILRAGAAPYFDIVPFHSYPFYMGDQVDYDNGPHSSSWSTWGGRIAGKARYLKQVLDNHGVAKPLFLNESALACSNAWYTCNPPPPAFFQAQADFVVRTYVRGLSRGIQAFIWYTLDGPGWLYSGLLTRDNNPRRAYTAHQHLATRLHATRFQDQVDYGPGVEAYSFFRNNELVHVVWSIDSSPDTIAVPQSRFLAAYQRDGAPLTPTTVGSDYQFVVGFSPIYIELRR